MRVYVIRHGETEGNAAGIFQGRVDGQLLESGYKLARVTGEALQSVKFDAVFSSPLSRARNTAQEVLIGSGNTDVPITFDDRLLEIDMGVYEGKKFRPGEREADPEMCRLFFEDAFAFPGFPKGEDARGVCARTQEFLTDLAKHDYDTVLVSTHGFALRAMLNSLYDNPDDFWQGHVPYNCSVSILEGDGDGLKLVEGDVVYYDKSLCVDRYASY
ncbi:Alpha-ribazole phosphatase [Slackia heliotrinireducens]|uniref:Fructose-2,6-bisphosphatase n=1 Tax=Slackia heliotrinireducens (strain ATCC 29202 / DSM 20476 / NCTC 11029 / RHS 1) TaxID=471855 RepID=C7N5T5_SLAHD|nr:histidine phosphatase family protein [Slackia heliotrinireducens]ACV22270.1 fructose-2,6-bisphosphatase [Slackia heliotrinireducens DSM 20476]VEH00441.1 Alpha-ribazole phosphatase [Slackia heliotrinireducens]